MKICNEAIQKCEIRSEKNADGEYQYRIWFLLKPFYRTRKKDTSMLQTENVYKTKEEAENHLREEGF